MHPEETIGGIVTNVQRNVGDAIGRQVETQLTDKIRPYVVVGAVGVGLFAAYMIYRMEKNAR